jgi:hypothetical protein
MANESYFINNDLAITMECQRTGATVDLSDGATYRIYYKKPSGTVGYWTATLSGTHQLVYNATSEDTSEGTEFDIDEAGVWLLKAYVVYNSGAVYQGDVCELEIKKSWQIQ